MLHSRIKKEDLETNTKFGVTPAQTSKCQVKAYHTQTKVKGRKQHGGSDKIAELKKRTNCAKCGVRDHCARECGSSGEKLSP